MQQRFNEWLNGLVEEDPIPFEVKHLLFIISEYDDRVELALTGSEKQLNISYPSFYFPLEAQCFFDAEYFNLRPKGRETIFKLTKQMILSFVNSIKLSSAFGPNGRSLFGNVTISLGFRGKKTTFLVKT